MCSTAVSGAYEKHAFLTSVTFHSALTVTFLAAAVFALFAVSGNGRYVMSGCFAALASINVGFLLLSVCKKGRETFPWNGLPTEIQKHILSFVDDFTLGRCLLSAKQFVPGQEDVWKERTLRTFSEQLRPKEIPSWKDFYLKHTFKLSPARNFLFNFPKQRCILNPAVGQRNRVFVHYDRMLATWESEDIFIYDLASEKYVSRLETIYSVVASAFIDQKMLAVLHKNRANLWDVEKNEIFREFEFEGDYHFEKLFFDGKRLIFSANQNKQTHSKIWDLESATFLEPICGKIWVNKNQYLIRTDKEYIIWEGFQKEVWRTPVNEKTACAFNERWLVVNSSEGIVSIDYRSPDKKFHTFEMKFMDPQFALCGCYLLCADYKYGYAAFNLDTQRLIYNKEGRIFCSWIESNLVLEWYEDEATWKLANVFTGKVLKVWPTNYVYGSYIFNNMFVYGSSSPHLQIMDFNR